MVQLDGGYAQTGYITPSAGFIYYITNRNAHDSGMWFTGVRVALIYPNYMTQMCGWIPVNQNTTVTWQVMDGGVYFVTLNN